MSHGPAIDNAYLDTHQPFEERARHLVSQLTLQEKIDQMLHIAPAIPRLNIPAYNRTNGEPCCASPTLLQTILRETWGFDGYVVSDCGAERDAGIAEAKTLAARADVVVLCLGLDPFLEGEEGDIANSDGQGDRTDVRLPACQERLLEALRDCGKPIVLVLTGGSPMTLPDTQDRPDAILLVWYPGQEGGHALADILFGDASPAGRLPVTFVKSLDQVPPFDDYRMAGRTYRFMDEEPLHRFGYGLSYTTFAYEDLTLTPTQLTEGTHLTVTLTVTNTGAMDSDDVVQAYLVRETSSIPAPHRQLVAFRRTHLRAGERRSLSLTIPSEALHLYADDGSAIWVPGPLTIALGGSQPGTPGATHLYADVALLPS